MNESWAALAGAVVGGVIAAVTSWALLRAQWTREDKIRRDDRLEAEVGLMLQLAATLPERPPVVTRAEMLMHAGRACRLAEKTHPNLADGLHEITKDLLNGRDEEGVKKVVLLGLKWTQQSADLEPEGNDMPLRRP